MTGINVRTERDTQSIYRNSNSTWGRSYNRLNGIFEYTTKGTKER